MERKGKKKKTAVRLMQRYFKKTKAAITHAIPELIYVTCLIKWPFYI